MAELLIKAVDMEGAALMVEEPIRKGFVVAVKEDGHTWGRRESKQQWIAEGRDATDFPGKFYIVKIPSIPAEDLTELLHPQVEDNSDNIEYETDMPELSTPKLFRQRKFKFDIDGIPTGLLKNLEDAGEITLNSGQAKSYIVRLKNGSKDFTGLG